MKITVKRWRRGGRWVWVVRNPYNPRPVHTFFSSKAAAEAEAARLRAEISEREDAYVALSAVDRSRLVRIYSDAKARGVDLGDALAKIQASPTGHAVEDVIREMVEKSGAGKRYLTNLAAILGKFAEGRERMLVSALTLADVESFLDARSVQSRSTYRARLSAFFRYCIRRGYRTDNPCERLERVKHTKAAPKVFTVKQTLACLDWLAEKKSHGLPWFVLSTLCGLRPEEAEKTRRSEINLKRGFVKVEAQTSKVRQRRVVHPRPEAMRLLKLVCGRDMKPLPNGTRKRLLKDLRAVLHWKAWPKDVTRHTAASYWLAVTQDPGYVATQLGHSIRVLDKNYKALVDQTTAEKFWKEVGEWKP